MQNARKAGVQVMGEDWFLRLRQQAEDAAAAMPSPKQGSDGEDEEEEEQEKEKEKEKQEQKPAKKKNGKASTASSSSSPSAAASSSSSSSSPNVFAGMTIAFTGKLAVPRAEAVETVLKYGGQTATTVTRNVTHLVCDDPSSQTAKMQNARKAGVRIMDEDWFLRLRQQAEDASSSNVNQKSPSKSPNSATSSPSTRSTASHDNDDDGDDDADDSSSSSHPKPLHEMKDGEAVKIQGGSGQYEIRYRGGVYYCTCTGWRFAGGSVDKRSCKHMREYLGDAFETWRIGRTADAPKVKSVKTNTPKLLLGHKWDGVKDMSGWHMSEKLDGVRAFWDGKHLISRLGNVFMAPDWFVADFPKDISLDGELWGGRKKFQSTVGIVKSLDAGERWKSLTYQVFDIPSMKTQPFEERLDALRRMFGSAATAGAHPSILLSASISSSSSSSAPTHKCKYIRLVEHVQCQNNAHLQQVLGDVVRDGGEGLMMRQPKSVYVGSRSNTILKVKLFTDCEAIVRGYVAGKGKNTGVCGALECELENGKTFNCGTGLSDKERAHPPPIGSIITVKYFELSEAGIPRFPTYVGIRIDAKWKGKK